MKSKLLLLASFVLVCFKFSFSQTQFGVQVSGLSASTKIEEDGVSYPGKKNLIGYKIGGIAKIGLTETFAFMPELNFISSGGKFSYSETQSIAGYYMTTNNEISMKPTFLEIPLNFAYHKVLSNDNSFFVGLGPVLSLGMGGKYTVDNSSTTNIPGSTSMSSSTSGNFKFDGKDNATATDDNFHLKALDFGGNVFVGYKLANGFFVKASYKIGFSNLMPDDNSSYKVNYFGFGVGYFFGSRK